MYNNYTPLLKTELFMILWTLFHIISFISHHNWYELNKLTQCIQNQPLRSIWPIISNLLAHQTTFIYNKSYLSSRLFLYIFVIILITKWLTTHKSLIENFNIILNYNTSIICEHYEPTVNKLTTDRINKNKII